jgi:glutamate decarboxylase
MAFKFNWKKRQLKLGRSTQKPNLVLGANVQVVWEKFCRYWEVEPRYIPIEKGRYVITPDEVIGNCDENTIGVVATLGTTFTGEFEPIKEINDALAKLNSKKSWSIPLHVDAASGGFVAPFLHPELEWDFRLSEVKSINVSGHKYGLVYPGIGFVIWRNKENLPEELIFKVNYLGGEMPTFTLNFSRPGNQVIAQYYNFLRLGVDGYTKIMRALQEIALYLSGQIAKMSQFELLSSGESEPVFAFKLFDEIDSYSVFNISQKLREKGLQVPAYTMPEDAQNIAVLRIVIREGFSYDMADNLLADIKEAVEYCEKYSKAIDNAQIESFSH